MGVRGVSVAGRVPPIPISNGTGHSVPVVQVVRLRIDSFADATQGFLDVVRVRHPSLLAAAILMHEGSELDGLSASVEAHAAGDDELRVNFAGFLYIKQVEERASL